MALNVLQRSSVMFVFMLLKEKLDRHSRTPSKFYLPCSLQSSFCDFTSIKTERKCSVVNRSSEEMETAASLWTCTDYETAVVTSICSITTHTNGFFFFFNVPCDDDVRDVLRQKV